MYTLFIFSVAAALLPFITANPVSRDAAECHGQEVLKQTYIGQSNDVLASYYTCSDSSPATSFAPPTARSLEGRTNECSAPCTTTCYTPSGGGPNPNDCTVVADALLYESQNTGLQFSIGPAGNGLVNYVTLTYASCNSTFVNQQTTTMTYCRRDWAGVVGYIAPNCQSTQNAHGGICVANDQAFFIQVNHS